MTRRLFIAALFVAVIAWAALWWRGRSTAPAAPAGAPADTTDEAAVLPAWLYFAASDGSGLVGEPRELLQSDDLHERVASLVGELDRGPRRGGVAVLPAGTAVRQVFLDDQGLLTVDLTSAFRRGFRGGATTEFLAVSSLVRTLGANLPEVKHVMIVCAGRPLATLGGHVPLDQPLDVAEWP